MGVSMKAVFSFVIWGLTGTIAYAETTAEAALKPLFPVAKTTDLSQFLWKNRVLAVLADSDGDPRYVEQIKLLTRNVDALRDRDVVLLTDTAPADQSPLREQLRPRGFIMVLMAKDGSIVLRKPLPWSVREISRSIDKLPLRQQEMRNQ